MMCSGDEKTWSVLRKIVAGLSIDPTMRQDMMQECLLRLIKMELEKPGQTRSWYLRNCRFHALHWLALGRSVDSPKRAGPEQKVHIDGVVEDAASERFHTNGDLMEEIFARDIFSTLLTHLRPREQEVLHGLARGLTLREIASERGLSYPTVLKYRDTIGGTLLKLYNPPLRARRVNTPLPLRVRAPRAAAGAPMVLR